MNWSKSLHRSVPHNGGAVAADVDYAIGPHANAEPLLAAQAPDAVTPTLEVIRLFAR